MYESYSESKNIQDLNMDMKLTHPQSPIRF